MEVTGSLSAALPLLCAAAFLHKAVSDSSTETSDGCTVSGHASVAEALSVLTAGEGGSQHVHLAVSAPAIADCGMYRMLLNAGVRYSAVQRAFYAKIAQDATAQGALAALASALSAHPFLAGAACGAIDAAVVGGLYDLLSLVDALPPSVERWYRTVVSRPEIHAVLVAHKRATGGVPRVGFQIDLRAAPATVAAAADAAVARNAVYKVKAQPSHAEAGATKETAAPPVTVTAAAAPAAAAAASAAGVPAASAAQPAGNKTLPFTTPEHRIELTSTRLRELGIAASTTRHVAANTVEALLAALEGVPGVRCKNLFVKAKKGKTPEDSRIWLVVAAHDTKTDLVSLATKLGYGKIVIRFAEAPDLLEHLGCVQGNVTPFALMNDTMRVVNVAVDKRLVDPAAGPLLFHPLTNEASTAISPAELSAFLASTGHAMTVVDFE